MRALVKSDWYQRRWPDTRINDGEDVQSTMGVYHTTAGGFRYSTTVGGGATGWHCHTQIVDDPVKPSDIAGDPDAARAALDRAWEWWRATMASRKADPSKFRRVVIMQRLGDGDLAARCIDEGYVHLMLPMRFERDRACVTNWGGDKRTVEGELLCPARFDEATVAETERDMGSQVAAAQLQQRPAPAKGLIFERKWLMKEWHELPSHPRWIQSWDCAFKDLNTSDYVVGQVWCQHGAQFYLVHQVRERMTFTATCEAIRKITKGYPLTSAKLVEDKANGTAVIDALTKEIPGLIGIEPDGGKIARANAVTPLFEAGNVLVPRLTEAPWIAQWREEMATFPTGRFDDAVDATTQAVRWMHTNPMGSPDQITSENRSRFSRGDAF
jgi:predicted phage terminase large subunit-like protein